MKKMILISREKRIQMGINGRVYMKKRFDKTRIVQDTIDHLDKII